jgi:hypothetical protein
MYIAKNYKSQNFLSMDCKKSNWQSRFPCKLFRFFVIVSPVCENRRSLGTELATIDNHFLAIGAKSLYTGVPKIAD